VKLIRFIYQGSESSFGILENDEVYETQGDILLGPKKGKKVALFKDVILLAPCQPS
jgi:hypothetical protein